MALSIAAPADDHQPRCRYSEIHGVVDRLVSAVEREDAPEVMRLCDSYVSALLSYAGARVEVLRSFFLPTVFAVLVTIERKHPIRVDAREQLIEDLVETLEESDSVSQLVDRFKDAIRRLSAISRAVQGPKIARVEAVLQYLRRNFTQRQRLPEVARRAGFSVPAFVQIFKETTGTSFLPFVRTLRVEFAKNLLTTTDMTIKQIAVTSGFRSQHHLSRSFRVVSGRAPSAFRLARRPPVAARPGVKPIDHVVSP